jgi:hypothetical protein
MPRYYSHSAMAVKSESHFLDAMPVPLYPRPMLTASEMGRKGGKARAAKMTAKERSEHMRRASEAFWAKLTSEERSALARKRALTREKNRARKHPRKNS